MNHIHSLIVVALLSVFNNLDLAAQCSPWRPGQYMIQAWSKTIASALYLEENSNFGLKNDFCVLGAYLGEGKSVSLSTYLSRSNEYVFIGGGDEDATDLDIRIKSESGTLLTEDNERDNNPVVRFQPRSSGTYTIELDLYDCSANGSFVCIALMKKYGNTVPVSNVVDVGKKFFEIGEEFCRRLGGVKFHDSYSSWCMYTSILDEGEYSQMGNVRLGSSNHIFYAVGDQNIDDVDLSIYDGNAWETDDEVDSLPILDIRSYSYKRYKVKTKNYDSNGKSLIITGILTR